MGCLNENHHRIKLDLSFKASDGWTAISRYKKRLLLKKQKSKPARMAIFCNRRDKYKWVYFLYQLKCASNCQNVPTSFDFMLQVNLILFLCALKTSSSICVLISLHLPGGRVSTFIIAKNLWCSKSNLKSFFWVFSVKLLWSDTIFYVFNCCHY